MRRKRMNARRDKRVFTKTAMNVSPRNVVVGPMRGGIRL